eukprot:364567-Chlamydomonas_euryale.AAC.8
MAAWCCLQRLHWGPPRQSGAGARLLSRAPLFAAARRPATGGAPGGVAGGAPGGVPGGAPPLVSLRRRSGAFWHALVAARTGAFCSRPPIFAARRVPRGSWVAPSLNSASCAPAALPGPVCWRPPCPRSGLLARGGWSVEVACEGGFGVRGASLTFGATAEYVGCLTADGLPGGFLLPVVPGAASSPQRPPIDGHALSGWSEADRARSSAAHAGVGCEKLKEPDTVGGGSTRAPDGQACRPSTPECADRRLMLLVQRPAPFAPGLPHSSACAKASSFRTWTSTALLVQRPAPSHLDSHTALLAGDACSFLSAALHGSAAHGSLDEATWTKAGGDA